MVCYSPLTAWQSFLRNPDTGLRYPVVFVEKDVQGRDGRLLKLPCQRCVGCRLERSRIWAGRLMHERLMWEDAWFITLTYDDAHLPYDGSLHHEDFQLFMGRLRDRLKYPDLCFYMCGEYGDHTRRPHFHLILFGIDFPDKKLWSVKGGNPLFISSFLESVWQKGFCPFGSVSFESCAYVARYIMKKRFGDDADKHYEAFRDDTGEVFSLKPEYTRMSLKPSPGLRFYNKYKFSIYEKDQVLINDYPSRPPRFYDLKFKSEHPDLWENVCNKRDFQFEELKKDEEWVYNQTSERLLVREQVKIAQISSLVRSLAA